MRYRSQRKRHYCQVHCMCFSDDGKFLLCGDNFGSISVFVVESCLNDRTCQSPVNRINLSNTKSDQPCASNSLRPRRAYALLSTENFLLCGCSDGTVRAYRWSDFDVCSEGASAETAFTFLATSGGSLGGQAEVCAMLSLEDDSKLATAGAGDNAVKLWDVETRTCLRSYAGHTDYVHDMCRRGKDEQNVVTVSEDGSCRLWDLRCAQGQILFEPHLGPSARPSLGPWLGCVAANDDWIVCGGGANLGLWHLGSRTLAKQMDAGTYPHHCVRMLDETIVAAGGKSLISHFDYRGERQSQLECSATQPYAVVMSPNTHREHAIMAVAGSSAFVDLIADGAYKARTLAVY